MLLLFRILLEPAALVATSFGRRRRRRRFALEDVYRDVVAAYKKVFGKEIAPEIVEEVVEKVSVQLEVEAAKVLPERDIEAEISVIERKAMILAIVARLEEEEDEETALFAML